MSKRNYTVEKLASGWAGFRDIEERIWNEFVTRYPVHAKALKRIDPLLGHTLTSIALSPKLPAQNWGGAELIRALSVAPDATIDAIHFARSKWRKFCRHRIGFAEAFMRSPDARDYVNEAARKKRKVSLAGIGIHLGMAEKDVRNAAERMNRSSPKKRPKS